MAPPDIVGHVCFSIYRRCLYSDAINRHRRRRISVLPSCTATFLILSYIAHREHFITCLHVAKICTKEYLDVAFWLVDTLERCSSFGGFCLDICAPSGFCTVTLTIRDLLVIRSSPSEHCSEVRRYCGSFPNVTVNSKSK